MTHRTLAELAQVRGGIEHAITRALIAKALTDGQRADREERLAGLHVRLSVLLAETETAAYRECPALAPTLRWAICGADQVAQQHTARAREWRKLDLVRLGDQP
jgi:hypothetical protein